ncbi:unnamed protein product [Amoebophrya sp. A120]|nr:unnamed protein product [Amoebophrya sp. A120]|eukprot:GSA120T00008998001.1
MMTERESRCGSRQLSARFYEKAKNRNTASQRNGNKAQQTRRMFAQG